MQTSNSSTHTSLTFAVSRGDSKPPRGAWHGAHASCGLVPIMAFMAFAIDVGMLTVAQTQLRDAADAAALAGCRALNGNSANNNNYSGAAPAAQTAITTNEVLGSQLTQFASSP